MSMSIFGKSFYSLQCWIYCVNPLVVVLALLCQHCELDCKENKLEVRLFDKQWSPSLKQMVQFGIKNIFLQYIYSIH